MPLEVGESNQGRGEGPDSLAAFEALDTDYRVVPAGSYTVADIPILGRLSNLWKVNGPLLFGASSSLHSCRLGIDNLHWHHGSHRPQTSTS